MTVLCRDILITRGTQQNRPLVSLVSTVRLFCEKGCNGIASLAKDIDITPEFADNFVEVTNEFGETYLEGKNISGQFFFSMGKKKK